MDLQARRCGCGAIFKLATLRARETECVQCQRVRVTRMQSAAVAARQLVPVLKPLGDRAVMDYQPAAYRVPVSTKFSDVSDPRGVVRNGQLFETWHEAAAAIPVRWRITPQLTGGFRVYAPGPLPVRKPVPAAAQPVAHTRTVNDRIADAAKLLREREQERAARNGTDYGLGYHLRAIDQAMGAQGRTDLSVGSVKQACDLNQTFALHSSGKVVRVIADPAVPPGKVVMHWTDALGSHYKTVPVEQLMVQP